MGSSFTKTIGPRSEYRADPNMTIEIDYRDPLHVEKAKRELYELFLDRKIIHVANFEQAQTEIQKLREQRDNLHKLLNSAKTNSQLKMQDKTDILKFQSNHIASTSDGNLSLNSRV